MISGVQMFWSEFMGTALMMAIAFMVAASRSLPRTGAYRADWINASVGWGLAVYIGVYAGWRTGGHLNPAVTLARVVGHWIDPQATLNGLAMGKGGIPVTLANVAIFISAQFLGAFFGSCLGYLGTRKHFELPTDSDTKLMVFCTKPAIRSNFWNLTSEAIGTAILVAWVFLNGGTPTQVGPLGVALVITVLVMALGGVSGAAMNPARDFSARLAYCLLPMSGEKDADWSYAWIPFVGPIVGACIGVLAPAWMGLLP